MCARRGLYLVGLNTPAHLLLASPPGAVPPFTVDCFSGVVMDVLHTATFVGQRCRPPVEPVIAARLVQQMRQIPMSPLGWIARLLRNLRVIYASTGDAVRLLLLSFCFL